MNYDDLFKEQLDDINSFVERFWKRLGVASERISGTEDSVDDLAIVIIANIIKKLTLRKDSDEHIHKVAAEIFNNLDKIKID